MLTISNIVEFELGPPGAVEAPVFEIMSNEDCKRLVAHFVN